MIDVFSDRATIACALAFETSLARAQAAEGLITMDAAAAIELACSTIAIDPRELAEQAALAGTLAIPIVDRLRAMLPEEAAPALHKGATSQDISDTVLMMQVVSAADYLRPDVGRLCSALRTHAVRHAQTPSMGRTLLQDALPVAFGLRLAQAALGVDRAADRLDSEIAANARLQFGGAAGTRSGLDGKGVAVAQRLAHALALAADMPWHARRDGVAGIAAALGILIGALAKFARDVSLLSQNAVGEAREPAIRGRGGSSAMAHKRNPTGSQIALSAALRAPGLVASILGGLPQEEERGLGGWQAEAPALIDLFLLAAGSTAAMATVAEGLEIDETAVARNLEVAGLGDDVGESAVIVAELLAQMSRN